MKMRSFTSRYGLAFLSALALTGCADKTPQLENQWRNLEVRARKAGVPLTPSEVMRGKPLPDDQNAAVGVKEAFRLWLDQQLPGKEVDFHQDLKPSCAVADQMIRAEFRRAFIDNQQLNYALLTKSLATLKPGLDFFEAALDKPGWDFKRDWDKGWSLLLADYDKYRSVVRWLQAEALVAGHNGKTDEALAKVAMIFKLAEHLRSEPMVTSIMGVGSCYLTGDQTALHLARIRPDDVKLIDGLRSLVNAAIVLGDPHRTWQMENAKLLIALEAVASEKGIRDLGAQPGQVEMSSREALLKARIKITAKLIEAEERWNGLPNDIDALKEVASRYEGPIGRIVADYNHYYLDIGIVSTGRGVVDSATDAGPMNEVRRRLNWLALTMVRSRGRQKDWQLPPEAALKQWLDPFSSKPMHLKREDKGFVLYSVGSNGIDDGGADTRDSTGLPLDIMVTYPHRRDPNKIVQPQLQ